RGSQLDHAGLGIAPGSRSRSETGELYPHGLRARLLLCRTGYADRGGNGIAPGADAAGRPRGGAGAVAAALATGQGGRRRGRAVVRRAGHRQVAPLPEPLRWAERRAARPLAPVLLAATPGSCALPGDRAARTGGRVPA